jgi:hypothetical protein
MQQRANVKIAVIGATGAAAVVLLVLAMFQFVAPKAEATPVIGQGKPCNACHTSPTPSKGDVKK